MDSNQLNGFVLAEKALRASEVSEKISITQSLYQASVEHDIMFDENTPVLVLTEAGRPQRPQLVAPKDLPKRSTFTQEGRAALLHSIAHIEFNAINLALDAVARFRGMPLDYYHDWIKVAKEEAYHFTLLNDHLKTLGYQYGDFDGHNGLWEMTQKTAYDVLARMALVPRLMEARGLDVSPLIVKKLKQCQDQDAVKILEIIMHDEEGHVKIGNRWYHYCCEQRGVDKIQTFRELLDQHAPNFLRKPFAHEARRRAGFSERELKLLDSLAL